MLYVVSYTVKGLGLESRFIVEADRKLSARKRIRDGIDLNNDYIITNVNELTVENVMDFGYNSIDELISNSIVVDNDVWSFGDKQ